MSVIVDIEIAHVGDLDDARRRLRDSRHVRRSLGDMLDEGARLGEQSAETYAPEHSRRLRRAISSVAARIQPDGAIESAVGVERVSGEGLVLGAEGDQVSYPWYVHEGTGLYGALHHRIYPRRAKAMRWFGRTGLVFAKSTRGQRPQPFVGEAYEDVLHFIPARIDALVRRILESDR